LQSKEDAEASENFKENGWINLDQSSGLSNFKAFRMYETGSAIRYLERKKIINHLQIIFHNLFKSTENKIFGPKDYFLSK